jgi:hypothetical protein
VVERGSGADDLTTILKQLQLQRADGKSPADVTHAQVELLLARIASLTDALRGAPQSGDASQITARLLLADVAMVAAQFRGTTTSLNEQLLRALERARLAIENARDTTEPAG